MLKQVFVFPGQGSQSVGMGRDLYDNFECARDVFKEVDDALNQKLSDIIFNGPVETLTLTANVQPAIMTISMAIVKVLEKISGKNLNDFTDYVAGHSLGEYSALCASRALTLRDTAKLLRIRGNAMQEAVPEGQGAMAVILGLDINKVQEICFEANKLGCCNLANDNAPGQIVISGSKNAIEKAMELSNKSGAKRAMILPLSVPPHSDLMKPAQEKMQLALNEINMTAPIVPLISNRTVTPTTNPEEIKQLLITQITNGVRWRETILFLNNENIDKTIEIGPGKVLTGLTSRIVPIMSGVSLNNLEDIKKFLQN